MIVSIEKSTAFGRITVPPSKSMAHRELICAALSPGSEVTDLSFSDDIKATLGGLESLGARVEVNGTTALLGGLCEAKRAKSQSVFCNESGSTLRFLLPMCLRQKEKITLTGSKRLFSRSLGVYEDLCREQGIFFEAGEDSVTVEGCLSPGKYAVRGDISSQFITGLMLLLPTLDGDSVIDITGKTESASYLKLTVKALADFGVRVSRVDANTFFIKGNQTFKKRKISVEGDYSNAAFFEFFNLFGGNVVLKGLKEDSVQGDRVYREMFPLIASGTPELDVSDCPDLAPVLMAAAAACNGVILTGTRRLRIKESDRGMAMAEELAKFGCKVVVEENRIEVKKSRLLTPVLPLSGHNDHRIVMAVAVLATLFGGKIYGAEAVSKSFPDFFDRLIELGIRLTVENA